MVNFLSSPRDFPDSQRFGIRCLTPKEFPILLEELP
jgi:hypothetical protein